MIDLSESIDNNHNNDNMNGNGNGNGNGYIHYNQYPDNNLNHFKSDDSMDSNKDDEERDDWYICYGLTPFPPSPTIIIILFLINNLIQFMI